MAEGPRHSERRPRVVATDWGKAWIVMIRAKRTVARLDEPVATAKTLTPMERRGKGGRKGSGRGPEGVV